jgi:hypothetical protein
MHVGCTWARLQWGTMERKTPSSHIYWNVFLIPDQDKYELQSQHPRVRNSHNRVTDIQYATLVFPPYIQFLYFYLLSYNQEIRLLDGSKLKGILSSIIRV